MAYPNGTIFDSAQTFPRYTSFGDGCIFAPGCVFENPCYFGEGCVFQEGCYLYKKPSKNYHPPHETGNGNVFAENCTLIFVKVGSANTIRNPATYEPVSEGPDTIVGDGNNDNNSCGVKSTVPYTKGQAVVNCKVSSDWEEAAAPDGFAQDNVSVKDNTWGL